MTNHNFVLAGLIICLFSSLFGCSEKEPNRVEGGLYYQQDEDGGFVVIKILKLDAHGLHVRVYSNRYTEPPEAVDPGTLIIGGTSDEDREWADSPGIGHLPISYDTFHAGEPIYFQQTTVVEDGLEGYKMWLEAGGGYF